MTFRIGRRPGPAPSRIRRGPRAWPAAVVSTLLAASLTQAAAARADSEAFYYSYNRPSIIEAGGAAWMTWADNSPAGTIHLVDFHQSVPANDTANPVSEWGTNAPTYYGTGPTVEASNGSMVVAFADTNQSLDLAELANGSVECYSYLGTSDVTPFLASEGKDGSGNLYLTWADSIDNTLYVAKVNVPTSNECKYGGSFSIQIVAHLAADTAWGGPALVVSGYGSTTQPERFWLMWSGTDALHHINVAEFDTSWNRLNKYTESDHTTDADIGGAYKESTNQVFLSYCGTNNRPYYQYFSATGFAENQVSVSGTCTVSTYTPRNVTYYSGGVGINYDYSDNRMDLAWPDNQNVEFMTF